MKTVCQFTSLPLDIPFLSSPTRIQFYHPVFTLSLKSLLGIYAQWKNQPASFHNEADTLLLTTAFLKASTLVEFRTSVNPKLTDHASLLQSLEPLIDTVCLVASNLQNPEFEAPSFIISTETASLDSLPQWIALWQESLEALSVSQQDRLSKAARARLESRLQYYIIHQKENSIYIGLMKEWLQEAAALPTSITIFHPFTKQYCSLASYWLDLLARGIKGEVFSLPLNDLQEFYDHLIENLDDVGSTFANAALSTLRKIIHQQQQGMDIPSTFVIVKSEEAKALDKANASLLSAIASQYTAKPERSQFATAAEYLRASLAWAATQYSPKP